MVSQSRSRKLLTLALSSALVAVPLVSVSVIDSTVASARTRQISTTDPTLGTRWFTKPSPATRTQSKSVYFIGDSLTVDTWTWGHVATVAQQKGWSKVGVDAQAGARAKVYLPRVKNYARNLPKTVLIALGTNDIVWNTPTAEYENTMTTMVNTIQKNNPKAHITLVNTYAGGDANLQRKTKEINGVIAKLGKRSNVNVYDWANYISHHQSLLNTNDPFKIHVTIPGTSVRARIYVQAVGKPRK